MMEFVRAEVDILNLSFGCFTDDRQPPLVLSRAVERLTPGIVIVAAAGNHGEGAKRDKSPASDNKPPNGEVRYGPITPIWPAAMDNVVAVGAADQNHKPAPFSPPAPWVDLLAPGVDEQSAYLFGKVHMPPKEHADEPPHSDNGYVQFASGHAQWSGTSFAAANVTGQLAARIRRGQLTAQDALWQLLRLPLEQDDGGVLPYRP
jgi:membrane-anchored mycosin MYCP